MPTSCQHFAFLQRRVDELGRKFVNDQAAAELASPTMFVPDLDQLAAYRLLVHAKLEDFLEAKAKEGIKMIEGAIASETTWVRHYPGLARS